MAVKAAHCNEGSACPEHENEKKNNLLFLSFQNGSYLVGGKFLNYFTEFYLIGDELPFENFSPTSSQWVGAWWLGFILIVGLGIFSAASLLLFPAKMKVSNQDYEVSSPAGDSTDDVMHMDRSAGYGDLKDMPAAIWKLVKNPTYFAISLGACMDAFILASEPHVPNCKPPLPPST